MFYGINLELEDAALDGAELTTGEALFQGTWISSNMRTASRSNFAMVIVTLV